MTIEIIFKMLCGFLVMFVFCFFILCLYLEKIIFELQQLKKKLK
jgi:hypothetical protein